MKNILITGCAGFIGSHSVECFLSDKDYKVFGLDKMTYASNMENLAGVMENKRFKFFKGDISNLELVNHICKENKIDIILNFAAETHVDNSILDATSFIQTNVKGVQVLLEVCKENKIPIFHVSTDEVYGDAKKNQAFSEKDRLNPKNPYAATKAAGEHLISSYSNTFGVEYFIVRPSNNFGPRQHKEKFLPTIIESLLEGKKIPIYGEGNQIREWTYVKDTNSAIKFILENSKINEVYNISSGLEMTNLKKVKEVLSHFPDKKFEKSTEHVEDRPGHDFRYSVDYSKLRSAGWDDHSSYAEALKQTVVYFTGGRK